MYVGSRAVVFRSKIGNSVTIGDKAVVIDVDVPDKTIIPAGIIVFNNETLDFILTMNKGVVTSTAIDEEPVRPTTTIQQNPGFEVFEGILVIVGLFLISMLRKR